MTWTITSWHTLRWLAAGPYWVATACNCQIPATITNFLVARRRSLLHTHSTATDATELNWTELASSVVSLAVKRPLRSFQTSQLLARVHIALVTRGTSKYRSHRTPDLTGPKTELARVRQWRSNGLFSPFNEQGPPTVRGPRRPRL